MIETDLNIAFKEALKYYTLKLRTLDLLHLVLSKIIGATKFVTFDKDIFSKRDRYIVS
ncbi:MAG: hypothetical protein MjAS7_2280 [Metallosphaera javensis (ex Sakai et al. 2022)]|nr:MAG: hypothetical protein MjAS7_2280 [Metallosphaera javensis (ex Sakai et al. 2022)]